MANRASLGL